MERLTHINENGLIYVDAALAHSPYGEPLKSSGAAIDRLAAYENTGLEPEEVANQTANLDFLLDKSAGSINANRLRELVKSDSEGRLKVLPCAVDATAYYADADAGRVLVGYVADYEFLRGGDCYFNFYNVESDIEWVSVELPIEEFGKTVFLTSEEAQTALRGGEGNG